MTFIAAYSHSWYPGAGQVISRNATDSFSVLANRSIEAVYTEGLVSDAPFVSITDDVAVRTSYYSYISRFYVPEDFTLIEWGMISNSTASFDMTTDGIVVHQGFIKLPNTNVFMMSFNKDNYNYVKAYIILKDIDGDFVTMYSDTKGFTTTTAPTEFYSTGFEDASKGSYLETDLDNTIITNGETWTLYNALLGSLAGDQFLGTKSIRAKDGYVRTEFVASEISEINFMVGKYGTDADSYLSLQISLDQTNWTVLDDEILSDASFDLYTFTFDSSTYSSLGLSPSNSYYIQLVKLTSARTNIDDFHILTGATSVTSTDLSALEFKQTKPVSITFPETEDLIYSVGDTFTDDTCYATDIVSGSTSCAISGSVSTNTRGDHSVTYAATSYEGITYTETKQYTVFRDASLLDVNYIGYYDGIEGLYGNDLLLALRAIINTDITRVSYGDVRYLLDDTDKDPNNSSNVLTIYTRESVSGVWDDGITWNREHVWPNSRLGVPSVDNTDIGIASDIHNLRACITSVNSSRSNKVYDSVTTSETYFPGDSDKGDVSRILFYMLLMYEELSLVNDILPNDPETNYTLAGAKMAIFDMLITWSYQDVVDSFEQSRNETIFGIQNNRNPFIDYSYFVELIWYDHANIPT
ncbi:MAG: endonuclease [Firmicutes bacterium]|nr:endonuclease [Bacillota bacterium]